MYMSVLWARGQSTEFFNCSTIIVLRQSVLLSLELSNPARRFAQQLQGPILLYLLGAECYQVLSDPCTSTLPSEPSPHPLSQPPPPPPSVLVAEPRPVRLLGKDFTTEPHPQPHGLFWNDISSESCPECLWEIYPPLNSLVKGQES